MINLSLLDYSPVEEKKLHTGALLYTTVMTQMAEKLSCRRFCGNEHYRIKSITGSNAEPFKFLDALYPGRINIGTGRSVNTFSFKYLRKRNNALKSCLS